MRAARRPRDGVAEFDQGFAELQFLIGRDGEVPVADRVARRAEVRSWAMSTAMAGSAHSITTVQTWSAVCLAYAERKSRSAAGTSPVATMSRLGSTFSG